MSHTQNTTVGAIARSIAYDEIVTVQIGPEECMQEAFDSLTANPITSDEYDYCDVTHTLREVWGTDADGNEWRVHLRQLQYGDVPG